MPRSLILFLGLFVLTCCETAKGAYYANVTHSSALFDVVSGSSPSSSNTGVGTAGFASTSVPHNSDGALTTGMPIHFSTFTSALCPNCLLEETGTTYNGVDHTKSKSDSTLAFDFSYSIHTDLTDSAFTDTAFTDTAFTDTAFTDTAFTVQPTNTRGTGAISSISQAVSFAISTMLSVSSISNIKNSSGSQSVILSTETEVSRTAFSDQGSYFSTSSTTDESTDHEGKNSVPITSISKSSSQIGNKTSTTYSLRLSTQTTSTPSTTIFSSNEINPSITSLEIASSNSEFLSGALIASGTVSNIPNYSSNTQNGNSNTSSSASRTFLSSLTATIHIETSPDASSIGSAILVSDMPSVDYATRANKTIGESAVSHLEKGNTTTSLPPSNYDLSKVFAQTTIPVASLRTTTSVNNASSVVSYTTVLSTVSTTSNGVVTVYTTWCPLESTLSHNTRFSGTEVESVSTAPTSNSLLTVDSYPGSTLDSNTLEAANNTSSHTISLKESTSYSLSSVNVPTSSVASLRTPTSVNNASSVVSYTAVLSTVSTTSNGVVTVYTTWCPLESTLSHNTRFSGTEVESVSTAPTSNSLLTVDSYPGSTLDSNTLEAANNTSSHTISLKESTSYSLSSVNVPTSSVASLRTTTSVNNASSVVSYTAVLSTVSTTSNGVVTVYTTWCPLGIESTQKSSLSIGSKPIGLPPTSGINLATNSVSFKQSFDTGGSSISTHREPTDISLPSVGVSASVTIAVMTTTTVDAANKVISYTAVLSTVSTTRNGIVTRFTTWCPLSKLENKTYSRQSFLEQSTTGYTSVETTGAHQPASITTNFQEGTAGSISGALTDSESFLSGTILITRESCSNDICEQSEKTSVRDKNQELASSTAETTSSAVKIVSTFTETICPTCTQAVPLTPTISSINRRSSIAIASISSFISSKYLSSTTLVLPSPSSIIAGSVSSKTQETVYFQTSTSFKPSAESEVLLNNPSTSSEFIQTSAMVKSSAQLSSNRFSQRQPPNQQSSSLQISASITTEYATETSSSSNPSDQPRRPQLSSILSFDNPSLTILTKSTHSSGTSVHFLTTTEHERSKVSNSISTGTKYIDTRSVLESESLRSPTSVASGAPTSTITIPFTVTTSNSQSSVTLLTSSGSTIITSASSPKYHGAGSSVSAMSSGGAGTTISNVVPLSQYTGSAVRLVPDLFYAYLALLAIS
ncbi:hypothetical protein HG535_0F00300 [Zygotorulaspora mrakii]|uniref:Uncharacterized protein n=1 Tax=Zygotorulaspora mrakii TaxID=42260 RepID=A0A7H9B4J8_ZYGMR|nr:uncharacterized protein HG535_0F00300 [Zygotorulaspora mrakii]QLG73520.1 hypothetical protein HG535_0F00300 [Zygotorulaspora mrakii]